MNRKDQRMPKEKGKKIKLGRREREEWKSYKKTGEQRVDIIIEEL